MGEHLAQMIFLGFLGFAVLEPGDLLLASGAAWTFRMSCGVGSRTGRWCLDGDGEVSQVLSTC